MNKNQIILFTVIIMLCSFKTFGQLGGSVDDIQIILPNPDNPNDKAYFEERAKQVVGQMNNYISTMASKNTSSQKRWEKRKDCLGLFVSNGEPFEEEGGRTNIAKMEVTSLNNSETRTAPVKNYFTALINLIEKGKYESITITSTEISQMQVSSLKKLSDTLYQCTVSFAQKFVGIRGERIAYADVTKKTATVYFVKYVTAIGEEFLPYLFNIKANAPQPIDVRGNQQMPLGY